MTDTTRHNPVAERMARIADDVPAHYFDCDEVEIPDRGVRKARCDCTATADMNALLAFARDALAMCDVMDGGKPDATAPHSLHTSEIRNAAARHLGGATR